MKAGGQNHCMSIIVIVFSVLVIVNLVSAGTGAKDLNNTSGSGIVVNGSVGNISAANQPLIQGIISGNETPLPTGSGPGNQEYSMSGNNTPALNNSSWVNYGNGTSPENGSIEPDESINDGPFVLVNNASQVPVSYTGLEVGSLTMISLSTSSDSYQPKIDRENIVWCTRDPETQTSAIILYNITTGEEISLTPPGNLDHANPAISGNSVVYCGQAPDDPVYRVYLYEIDTAVTSLLTSPDDQTYRVSPVISGNYAVWTEFDTGYGGIVLHDLLTNSSRAISPDSTLLDNSLPSISGDYVVWQVMNMSDSTVSIWLHQISANVTTRIPPPGGSESQVAPSIDGDRIVYAEGFGGEWDIIEYSLSTGEHQKISPQNVINNNPQTAIDGNLVAWVDRSEAYGNIFLYDRQNSTVSLLTPADPDYSSKTGPSISGNRIVWECNKVGRIDNFMFTRGPPADPLVVDFSANQTIGKSPLVINFKDKSYGSPTAWNWNFGDSETGTGQEVNHTFITPGLYSVTLTVNNQFYRNATRKTDMINVATPPEAGFSTNISSGPSPLTVQFGDASTGSPVKWSWDFGDGESDNTTSPVHTYQNPGIYSPRLYVANDFGNTTIVKENLIIVLPATHSSSTAGLEGLEEFENDGGTSVVLNITGFGGSYFLSSDNQVLTLSPPQPSWIKDLILHSGSSGGFTSTSDGFIVGNISRIEVTTRDILGGNPGSTDAPGSKLNVSAILQSIPLTGELDTTSWEGITSNDLNAFRHAIDYAGFVGITGSAYSVQVTSSGIEPFTNVTLHFSVNSSWVEENGGRDSVYVLRKASDGGLEVLPTTFLGNHSDENMDYFRADSPRGLSTFVVSSLHGSGNPLQLFYLSVSTRVVPSASGGGGGGGGGSYGGNGNQALSAQIPDTGKGTQSGATQEGTPEALLSNNGQSSGSQSQESASKDSPLANPAPQVSIVPAANPPVLPPQPTNSIFTMLIEAAAIVSIFVLVVFSVYMRNRKLE